jgi:hypothetical protein
MGANHFRRKRDMDSSEVLITLNKEKLTALRKYEKVHHYSFADRHVYYAVVHEIEKLEKQNKWLNERSQVVSCT